MLEKYGNLQNIYNILSSEKIDFKGESSIEVYGFKLLKQKI
jgi:hypothetical protein